MVTCNKSTCSERVCTEPPKFRQLAANAVSGFTAWGTTYTTCSKIDYFQQCQPLAAFYNLQRSHAATLAARYTICSDHLKHENHLQKKNRSLQVAAASCKKLQVVDFVASGIAAKGLLQVVTLQMASTYHLQQSPLKHLLLVPIHRKNTQKSRTWIPSVAWRMRSKISSPESIRLCVTKIENSSGPVVERLNFSESKLSFITPTVSRSVTVDEKMTVPISVVSATTISWNTFWNLGGQSFESRILMI